MKDWNNIRWVVVYTYGKPNPKYYTTLKDAIIALYRGHSYYANRPFVEYINNRGWLRSAEYYWCDSLGDHHHIYDDLGLLVPQWKIKEVYDNCSDKELGCWWTRRKKKFKFRDGPVEGIRCWNRGRHGKGYVWQAIKQDHFDKYDDDLKEYKFKRRNYEERFWAFQAWERDSNWGNDNWKEYRKNRWK